MRLYSYLGRAGAEPGIRELIGGGPPYLILYRVRRSKILIATIADTAQQRDSTTSALPDR